MTTSASTFMLALVAAGYVLVALGALWAWRRGPDPDARHHHARLMRELRRHEGRGRTL